MFPYDVEIAAAATVVPRSIDDVIGVLTEIGSLCVDGDGLKWFNWLYLQVTLAVKQRVNTPGVFVNPAWMAALDVDFAGYYLHALQSALAGGGAPGCWQAVFNVRSQTSETRLQFALAGMNAHINHDLPQAVINTCQALGFAPAHGTAQYEDYTAINPTLDAIIGEARQVLDVRLAGDSIADLTRLENLAAAWGIAAAREIAWKNAEVLWHIKDVSPVSAAFLSSVDETTAVASKALLVPV
jgi:hypothetical protein